MEKRGQFYLVAAIIIALVVFGLASVSNYASVEEKETVVFDLRQELGGESGYVIDFALYSQGEISQLIENWTNVYVAGKQDQEIEDWVFVYGDPSNITVLAFVSESSGVITVDSGAGSSYVDITSTKVRRAQAWGDYVNVSLGNFTYSFDMNSGQNFAFLIKKQGYVADSTTGKVIVEIEE